MPAPCAAPVVISLVFERLRRPVRRMACQFSGPEPCHANLEPCCALSASKAACARRTRRNQKEPEGTQGRRGQKGSEAIRDRKRPEAIQSDQDRAHLALGRCREHDELVARAEAAELEALRHRDEVGAVGAEDPFEERKAQRVVRVHQGAHGLAGGSVGGGVDALEGREAAAHL